MSFSYTIEIKQGNSLVESSTRSTLTKAVTYADSVSLEGDLVVISETYEGLDGEYDKYDHVTSWYVH